VILCFWRTIKPVLKYILGAAAVVVAGTLTWIAVFLFIALICVFLLMLAQPRPYRRRYYSRRYW